MFNRKGKKEASLQDSNDNNLFDPNIDPLEPQDDNNLVDENNDSGADQTKNYNDLNSRYQKLEENLAKQNQSFEALVQHNKALEEKLSQGFENKKQDDGKILADKIKETKKARQQALMDGDHQKFQEFDDFLDDLKELKIKEGLKATVPDYDTIYNKVKQDTTKTTNEELISNFTANNSWFNHDSPDYDEAMADAAIGLETRLQQKIPNLGKRLKEVERIIKERFNYEENTTPPANLSMEGGNKRPNNSQQKTIKFSPDEEDLINRLYPGDPKGREKFLKQKLYLDGRRG